MHLHKAHVAPCMYNYNGWYLDNIFRCSFKKQNTIYQAACIYILYILHINAHLKYECRIVVDEFGVLNLKVCKV